MFKDIFRAKDGSIVIWQMPNAPLIVWIISVVLARITPGDVSAAFSTLATAAILTWAYLEKTNGVNLFRRVLGVVVAFVVIGRLFL